MVVDIRPATGAVETLARTLWGVVGSSPACATCARCALCARVESPVRNRLSASILPFCVRFSRKVKVYKLFIRRDWYKPKYVV